MVYHSTRYYVTLTIVLIGVPFLLAAVMCMHGTPDIMLGEHVHTTEEYEQVFNDSFSGRVVLIDHHKYTVRNSTGAERVFEQVWIEGGEMKKLSSISVGRMWYEQ